MTLTNRLRYMLVLFTTTIFFSCNVPEKEYFPDGKNIKFKYYPKAGWFFEYYENAKMKRVAKMTNKVLNGYCITYYDNGNIWTKATFQNGKANGYFAEYYSTGGLEEEAHFKDGLLSGITKNYYENGKLKSNGFHQNNALVYLKGYDETGRVNRIFRAFTAEMNDKVDKDKSIAVTISEKGPAFKNTANLLAVDFILDNGDTTRYYRAFPIWQLVTDITIEEVPPNTDKILFTISEQDLNTDKFFYTWVTKDVTVQ